MADFALELSFTPADDARVRDAWLALQRVGLPSQADNARGMINAPHLSLVVAREIPSLVRERGARFASVLPCEVVVRGLIVLGEGPRVTVAYLAEPPAQLAREVNELRSATPALRHPVWTPHVTLARHVPRERVGEALAVIEPHRPRTLIADRVRWWDPQQGTIETVAGYDA